MTYLVKTVGGPLRKQVTRKFGADSAKLYDLAVHTTVLTMIYGPEFNAEQLQQLTQPIEQAARDAGVPERFWKPLLQKVAEKSETIEVRQAVVKMQEAIGDYLENESKREP